MKNVLVSGFGPFPGVDENPSGAAIQLLQSRPGLQTAVLPVTFSAVDSFIDGLADFDLIIHCGVAVNSTLFRLESLAVNKIGASPDAAGVIAGPGMIEPEGPDCYSTSLDLELLHSEVSNSEISTDAGDYLCNYTYYRSLVRAEDGTDVLFLHVPPVDPNEIANVINAILGCCS